MHKDKEQLDSLIHAFQELQGNPAYQYMVRRFDNECLIDSNDSLQNKAERYIAESAVKRFLRNIDIYAAGIPDSDPEQDLFLEPEDESVDESEDIFS